MRSVPRINKQFVSNINEEIFYVGNDHFFSCRNQVHFAIVICLKVRKGTTSPQYSMSSQTTLHIRVYFVNKTSGSDVLGGSEVELRVRDKRNHFDDIEMSNWPMKLGL